MILKASFLVPLISRHPDVYNQERRTVEEKVQFLDSGRPVNGGAHGKSITPVSSEETHSFAYRRRAGLQSNI